MLLLVSVASMLGKQDMSRVYVALRAPPRLSMQLWTGVLSCPQAFAVFLPVKSVGVQGDQRKYSHVVALRAVTSSDGMTADWYPFTPKFLQDVSSRICNKARCISQHVRAAAGT